MNRDAGQSAPRLTARGVATKARIVSAAAVMMYLKGVAATTLGEVLVASATSKSQFRQHFVDKDDLVREVIALRAAEIIGKHDNELLETARIIALTHHEKWDGSGYPDRLKGEQIDKLTQMVAMVDEYGELCHPQDQSKAKVPHAVLSFLFKHKTKQLNKDYIGWIFSINL